MKKLLLAFPSFAFFLTIILVTPQQFSGQGISINNDGSSPNASAMGSDYWVVKSSGSYTLITTWGNNSRSIKILKL